MAEKQLSDLPAIDALSGAASLYLLDSDGNSRKVLLSDLKAFINTDPTLVPSSVPWRGARVRRSSDVTGLTFPYVIAWNEEVEDTDGFWSVGAPTRLIVPAGVTRVRLAGSARYETLSTAGSLQTYILKNGAELPGSTLSTGREGSTGLSSNAQDVVSWDEPVTTGDYFELRTHASMSGQDQILSGSFTWFQITVVEG